MPDAAERLRGLDTCAVSDALDKLGLRGAVSGLRRFATSQRIAGRVRTVRLGAATGAASNVHLAVPAIERAEAGDVIAIEQRTGIDAACWGGILSVAAKLRGIVGVIAEGPVRDIDEASACEFPVFARSVTPRTARGRIAEVASGGAVAVGDLTVEEGDYAIADGSGVVFIAAGQVDAVLAAAEEIAARERASVDALRGGAAVSRALNASYERMLDA